MTFDLLVEMELSRHDWSRITEANGAATGIPNAVRELLASKSPADAKAAYWKLENHVVVQGGLFEAARYIVSALCAGLVQFDRPKWVRVALLELLFQIVNGESRVEEKMRGLADLRTVCRAAAREGMWLFYRIFQEGELWSAAKEIIEIIDEDTTRLATLQELNRSNGRVDIEQTPKITEHKI